MISVSLDIIVGTGTLFMAYNLLSLTIYAIKEKESLMECILLILGVFTTIGALYFVALGMFGRGISLSEMTGMMMFVAGYVALFRCNLIEHIKRTVSVVLLIIATIGAMLVGLSMMIHI
jgi:hypothetical protein